MFVDSEKTMAEIEQEIQAKREAKAKEERRKQKRTAKMTKMVVEDSTEEESEVKIESDEIPSETTSGYAYTEIRDSLMDAFGVNDVEE